MGLSPDEQKKISDLYNNRFIEFGRDFRTVGWGSWEDQILRFEMLVRDLDLEGKRILDVGCGLGDLVPFLEKRCAQFSYVGIDVAEQLITNAKQQYNGRGYEFICDEFLSLPEKTIGRIDVAVLSGALSYRIIDNVDYARKTIKKMFHLSETAACFNFLTSYVDFTDPKNFHFKPEEIFSYCKKHFGWVTLYHDYPLWEFTIQIRKNIKKT